MNTAQTVEEMIVAKGLTAPRVTPADIADAVVKQHFHRFPGTTFMVCLLELRNGFTVCGESACADPANFDLEVGMRIARENAERKIWPLEGYLLKERLHEKQKLAAAHTR